MEIWGYGYKKIIEICRSQGYLELKWEELGSTIQVTFCPHAKTILYQ